MRKPSRLSLPPAPAERAPEPLWWTVQDVATALQCSQASVYAWAQKADPEERLPSLKFGKLRRFIPAEVRAWIARQAHRD